MKVSGLIPILAAVVLVLPTRVAAEEPDCNEPNVLILLDVSGSMGPASDPTGKYMAAVTAVADIVTEYTWDIRFGLTVFPDPAEAYCGISTGTDVTPAIGTAELIKDYLLPGGTDFFGGPLANFDTPMYQALAATGNLDVLAGTDRRSYVLLITDGEQDCCYYGDYDDDPDCLPGTNNLDPVEIAENRSDLVQLVTELKEAGLPVFVVGFGEGVDTLTLNGMAVAAGTEFDPACDPDEPDPAQGKTCYGPADDIASLEAVMEDVVLFLDEEVCDSQDNDCDGQTDEGFPVDEPCDGSDPDSCTEGLFFCDPANGLQCDEIGGPGREELCNGEDDDCDGQTDEDFVIGLECDGEDDDDCADGQYVCGASGKGLVCDEAGLGRQETCNAEDDDCDGLVDDGADEFCQTACGTGSKVCEDGVLLPCDARQPTMEICGNGADDDCDGVVDEDFDEECGNDCGPGTIRCVGGVLQECDAPGPQEEMCDLVDNDCDGVTDNGNLCGFGEDCFCGACQAVCGANDTCGDALTCENGFCVDTKCPEGSYCAEKACVPGSKPPDVEADSGTGGGCGCRSAGSVNPSGHWVLVLLLLVAIIRRTVTNR